MDSSQEDDQLKVQLQALGAELKRPYFGRSDLRSLWIRYERFWPAVVTVVRKVPVYGDVVARLLEALGNALSAQYPARN